MSITLQTYIVTNVPNNVWCAGEYHGGTAITAWVGGSTGAYTRASKYDADLLYHKGAKYDKLIVVWCHGETDAETETGVKLYRERLEAYFNFLKLDLLTPNGEMFVVLGMPWDLDSNGYGEFNQAGRGDRIRTIIQGFADRDPVHYATVETKDGDRTGDVAKVHVSRADVLAITGPRFLAQVQTFINA